METYGLISILPPIISIILALYTKDVLTSLFLGCFSAFTILANGNIFSGISNTLMSLIKVFESNGSTICIAAALLIGGLLTIIEKSGGIEGFVKIFTSKKSIVKSSKGAQIFTWLIGILVFTSGSVSALVTGTVAKPLGDAFKVPHEKLSYIVHSTTSPVCALLPLSAWGAYMIGLIQDQGVDAPVSIMVKSIPLNFYCIIAVLLVPIIAISGKDYGPMKKSEQRAKDTGLLDKPKSGTISNQKVKEVAVTKETVKASTPLNLIIPILSMVGMIIAGLAITGNGDLLKGNGMTAVLWGTSFALLVAMVMYTSQKLMTYKQVLDSALEGASGLFSVAIILVFAWAFGGAVKQLGTGYYLATSLSGILTSATLPPLIFLIGCIISFATGSSWGTMAIMTPIAMPMALASGSAIPLVFAAIVGGSIFGDHSSPISDTTIMSCVTTGCDVMDHVKTQLPYALTSAGGAIVLYFILGLLL